MSTFKNVHGTAAQTVDLDRRYTLKQNEAEARQRLRAFWAGASLGRPAIHAVVRKPGHLCPPAPQVDCSDKEREFVPAWQCWKAHEAPEGLEYAAEAMPRVDMVFGRNLMTVPVFMDYSLYHLDGTCQMRFLDQLASLPRLNGIQWNPEPGASDPLKWLPAFREIRQRRLSLLIGCSPEEAVGLTKALGPDGLLLSIGSFSSVSDAEQAIRALERAC